MYVGVFQPSFTAKDNDILFTTEGITQVIKGKLKENIPYDKIKINNEIKKTRENKRFKKLSRKNLKMLLTGGSRGCILTLAPPKGALNR